MTILNHKKTADHITNWIRDYATNAGIKSLILGLSGGIDSALVALLCKRTGLPLICVSMPCHSSETAWLRAKAFADEYSLNLIKVDLSAAHDSVYGQAKNANLAFPGDLNNPIAVGGLRSCLRAPTLSFFANTYRGIIMGTGNRSEDHITRYFQKFGDGCVDICPVADLFKSEIRDLFAYLATYKRPGSLMADVEPYDQVGESAQVILDAKPTADLWGPDSGQEDEKELGISYDEIEWADREDMRTQKFDNECNYRGPGIIFSAEDPAKSPTFFRYTARQKEVIAKLHSLEKISRHKFNPNLPVCQVRGENLGLVS